MAQRLLVCLFIKTSTGSCCESFVQILFLFFSSQSSSFKPTKPLDPFSPSGLTGLLIQPHQRGRCRLLLCSRSYRVERHYSVRKTVKWIKIRSEWDRSFWTYDPMTPSVRFVYSHIFICLLSTGMQLPLNVAVDHGTSVFTALNLCNSSFLAFYLLSP